MSKKILSFITLVTLGVTLWGCSSNNSNDKDTSSKNTAKAEKISKNKKSVKKDKSSEKKEVSSSETSSSEASSASTSQESQTSSSESGSQAGGNSQAQASTKTESEQQSKIKPITGINFAIAVADQAFEEVVPDGETFPIQGTDPTSGPNSDGSFTLKTYAGAKGLNVYTLTPLPDGQIKVHAEYGSVQGGEFQDGGTKTIRYNSGN